MMKRRMDGAVRDISMGYLGSEIMALDASINGAAYATGVGNDPWVEYGEWGEYGQYSIHVMPAVSKNDRYRHADVSAYLYDIRANVWNRNYNSYENREYIGQVTEVEATTHSGRTERYTVFTLTHYEEKGKAKVRMLAVRATELSERTIKRIFYGMIMDDYASYYYNMPGPNEKDLQFLLGGKSAPSRFGTGGNMTGLISTLYEVNGKEGYVKAQDGNNGILEPLDESWDEIDEAVGIIYNGSIHFNLSPIYNLRPLLRYINHMENSQDPAYLTDMNRDKANWLVDMINARPNASRLMQNIQISYYSPDGSVESGVIGRSKMEVRF